MKHFLELYQEKFSSSSLPWLVLGKGPSFAQRGQFDLTAYQSIGLNHVVQDCSVTFAHLIDIDVVEDCAEILEANAEFLIMPWIPHRHCSPGTADLASWVEQIPVLKRFSSKEKLLWYDLSSSLSRHGAEPVIEAGFFSAESVLHLLALAGVKAVKTLGIDGGVDYSEEFKAVSEKTKFANGRLSFDLQFDRFVELKKLFQIEIVPLTVQSPVRVLVGCSRAEWLPYKVLEYSIDLHSRLPVECYPLYEAEINVPSPRHKRNMPRTAFSFQRFLIPQLTNYQGRAIYLDSDMEVLKDITALWTLPFDGASVLGVDARSPDQEASKFSVMLLDCENLSWKIEDIVSDLDAGIFDYNSLMQNMSIAKTKMTIPPIWNTVDHVSDHCALIHYTDLNQQPWLTRFGPLQNRWFILLQQAIEAGHLTMAEVEAEVNSGYVRPSLLTQLQLEVSDPFALPLEAVLADADFIPPHKRRPNILKQIFSAFFGR